MYVYNLHYENGMDGKVYPILTITGEQSKVKVERAGCDRLMKYPLYVFNEEKEQNFIVRWTWKANDEEDKDYFIELFGKLVPYFKVLSASINEGDDTLINASGIAACTEEELLEFFIVE